MLSKGESGRKTIESWLVVVLVVRHMSLTRLRRYKQRERKIR